MIHTVPAKERHFHGCPWSPNTSLDYRLSEGEPVMHYIVSFKIQGNVPSEQRMGQILTKLGYHDFEAINQATWKFYSTQDIQAFTKELVKAIGHGIAYTGGQITGAATEEAQHGL